MISGKSLQQYRHEQKFKKLKQKQAFKTGIKIARVVTFPFVVVVGAFGALFLGAIFAVIGESMKKIEK